MACLLEVPHSSHRHIRLKNKQHLNFSSAALSTDVKLRCFGSAAAWAAKLCGVYVDTKPSCLGHQM